MFSQAVQKIESEFEINAMQDAKLPLRLGDDPSAPVLATFLERDLGAGSAQVLAFNTPMVAGSKIVSAKRDRDFQVIEAYVAVTYTLPLDGQTRTRRVLASLRIGGDFARSDLRARLTSQAEEFFVLMVNAGREAMFPLIRTH